MTTTDRDFTPERAVEVLSPDGGYLWHSGGGIMLARIDFAIDTPAEDWPYVLINDARDVQGEDAEGWYVGYYATSDADGTDHSIAADPEALREAVREARVYAARPAGTDA